MTRGKKEIPKEEILAPPSEPVESPPLLEGADPTEPGAQPDDRQEVKQEHRFDITWATIIVPGAIARQRTA